MALEDSERDGPVGNKESRRPGTAAYGGGGPWWRRCWAELAKWWRRERPELTKVVSLIEIKLLQAELFPPLFPEKHEFQEVWMKLNEIHREKPTWSKDLDKAHVVNHELNQLLPLIATDEYLCADLEYELNTEEVPEGKFLIKELFNQTEITDLLCKLRSTPGASAPLSESNAQEPLKPKGQDRHESKTQDRRSAEQLLKRLYEARDEGWTYQRALARLKRYYLFIHAIVVAVLLVSLGRVIVSASGGADRPLDQFRLVTLAAALGSTLAATRKLRDTVLGLNDYLAIVVVVVVQALIGAALGLVAWLLLTSGALQIGGASIADWKTYTLVAFASGFSEPFSLQLIARFIETS